jgi:hypothetical protein
MARLKAATMHHLKMFVIIQPGLVCNDFAFLGSFRQPFFAVRSCAPAFAGDR